MKFSSDYEHSDLLQGFRYMDPRYHFNRSSGHSFRISEIKCKTSILIGELAENLGIILSIIKDEPQVFRREFCLPDPNSLKLLPSIRIDYAEIGKSNFVKKALEFKNNINHLTLQNTQFRELSSIYSDRFFMYANKTSVHRPFLKSFLDIIVELKLDHKFEDYFFYICHLLEIRGDETELQTNVDILERVIDSIHYSKKPYLQVFERLENSILQGSGYPKRMAFLTNVAVCDDKLRSKLIQSSIKPYFEPDNLNLFTKFLIRGVRKNNKDIEIQANWSAPYHDFKTGTDIIQNNHAFISDLTSLEKIMSHNCSNLDFWSFLENLHLPLEIIARSKKISIDYIQ